MMKILMLILTLGLYNTGKAQTPIDATFTYQGELTLNNALQTGSFDFEISAYDELVGGNIQDSPAVLNGIDVTNGIFTLPLNFGDATFIGNRIYLEIRVRESNNGASLELLSPRQLINSAPYAIHAQFVGANSVTTNEILDATISTQDLADNSVTQTKLADNSVDTAAIQNAAITAVKIANNAIGEVAVNATQVQLRVNEACVAGQYITAINQNGTVNCQIDITANTTVTSANIVDGTITTIDLADTIITANKLADNSVTSTAIAANSIDSSHIVNNSIGANDVDNSAIQLRVGGSCANGEFMDGVNQDGSVSCRVDTFGVTSVNSQDIVDGTIIAADISANAIVNSKISNNAVTANKIANGSVGSSEIVSSQIQVRINSTCDMGYYLTGVNEDGSVICQQMPISLDYSVDTVGVTGEHTSIVVRPATGFPIISYYELQGKDLKIFNCTNTVCSTGTSRLLDTGIDVGKYNSITLHPITGAAVISYYDESNKDLKLYLCNDINCDSGSITTLDTVGSVGLFTSITNNAQGQVSVSYYDLTNQNLKVHTCFNLFCSSGNNFALDSGGNVGTYTSIVLREASGFPIVSYRDDTNVALKVFDCSNTFCSAGTARTLDTTLDVGTHSSIAINNSNNPVISYYSFSNKDLKLYTCSNSSCSAGTVRTLDSTDQVGLYSSLAIDPNTGNSIVSYFDSTNTSLKLYLCANLTCSQGISRTIDDSADVGRYASIAIASNGYAIMSYFDNSNADLKVLNCANALCN